MSNLDKINIEDLVADLEPTLVAQARLMVNSGSVTQIEADNRRLEGLVSDGDTIFDTMIDFGRKDIRLYCECDSENAPCVHILALLLAFMGQKGSAAHTFGPSRTQGQVPAMSVPALPFHPLDPKKLVDDYSHFLERLTVPQMRELAARRKIDVSGLKRAIVQKMVSEGLASHDNLTAALQALPPDSRRVVDFFGLLGSFQSNQTPAKNLTFYLDAAQPEEKHPRPSSACLDELVQAGLIFTDPPFYLAPEAILNLKQPNLHLLPAYNGPLGRVELANPQILTSLALRLLMTAQSGQLELEPLQGNLDVGGWKTGIGDQRGSTEREVLPQDPCLRPALLEQLARSSAQPEEKIDMIAQLLADGGFWEPRKPAKLSQRFTEWLSLDLVGQVRSLLEILMVIRSQMELDLARESNKFVVRRSTRGYLQQNQLFSVLCMNRWRMVQLLARLPAGTWFHVDDALRLLHGLQPDLFPGLRMRPEAKPGQLLYNSTFYLEWNKKPVDLLNYDAWRPTYGQFHANILSTSLHWLGLCDLAWEGKQVKAFRLSAFGEILLGRSDQMPDLPRAESKRGLALQSDLSFEFLPNGADAQTAGLVLLVCDPVGNRKAAGSSAARLLYRLSGKGIGRALEAGWSAEHIRAVFEQALGQPLPPALSTLINRVSQRFGKLQIYTDMALVQFTDDFCLPELLAGTQLNRILLHTFSPRLIAIRADAANDFLQELRTKGYTPRLEDNWHE